MTGLINPVYKNQEYLNIDSTFDSTMPELSKVENATDPISSLLGQKTEIITTTYKIFREHPEYFGANAESLLYAQYAGNKMKPATYYGIFEYYIKSMNKTYIEHRRKGIKRNDYFYDTDYIITWARIIKNNHITLEYEPSMKYLNNVFNNWLQNPQVNYGGIKHDLKEFKPLCYTYSGYNFIELIPYIAYLFTFFIYCAPYEFDDAQSESSAFGFYRTLNSWYEKHYAEFGKDYGLNILEDYQKAVATIPTNYWIDMYAHMLKPEYIIKIRNNELSRTPNLLEQCIQAQNGITTKYIAKAWDTVMTTMIRIVIKNSPIRHIFDSIPRFQKNVLDINELMMWTQYCLAGGDKYFCIDGEINTEQNEPGKTASYSYLNHGDVDSIKGYPSAIVGKPFIKSNIKRMTMCKGDPFAASDLMLEMCTSYIKKEFVKKQTDILDDEPINISEPMLISSVNALGKSYSDIIKDLFVNGLWMYDNTSMSELFDLLMNPNFNKTFNEEMSDLLSLNYITQLVYKNRMASTVIVPYVLSYMNEWLLESCVHGCDLKSFSPFMYIVNMPEGTKRISKLLNMTIAMMYLSNPMYCQFVNNCVINFNSLIMSNGIIQQPYVKGLDDSADVYALNGCELYNFARYSNPLIRGYGFVSTVFGNCENLETFYRWIYRLNNSALFEVIDESLRHTSIIETSLNSQWIKMFSSRQYPNMLRNYTFGMSAGNVGYKLKGVAYFLSLKTSNDISILNLICKYTFPYSNARNSVDKQIYFRNIVYKNNAMIASKPTAGGMNNDGIFTAAMLSGGGTSERVPIYDFNGNMDDVGIVYTNPRGFDVEKLILFNSRYNENQTIWIFHNKPKMTRFQKYKNNNYEVAPEMGKDMMIDRLRSRRV